MPRGGIHIALTIILCCLHCHHRNPNINNRDHLVGKYNTLRLKCHAKSMTSIAETKRMRSLGFNSSNFSSNSPPMSHWPKLSKLSNIVKNFTKFSKIVKKMSKITWVLILPTLVQSLRQCRGASRFVPAWYEESFQKCRKSRCRVQQQRMPR